MFRPASPLAMLIVGATLLGASGCGGGTSAWSDYLYDNGLLPVSAVSNSDTPLADATHIGQRMCPLLTQGVSPEMAARAYGPEYPEVDPYTMEALAYGAREHLCDKVD